MKRRTFIKSAAASSFALPLTRLSSIENFTSKDQWVSLAIATICLDGFGDEDFVRTFQYAPEIGVRNIEFNVWHPRNITPQGIEKIRHRCDEHNLRPISLQGSSFGGNVIKDVSHKLWLMQNAKNLGCRRIKFTGSKRDTNGGLANVIKTLKELAPAAESMDMLIAVENHANNTVENLNDYEEIFAVVDSSHVGMCLDMGHFDGSGIDNFTVIDKFHTKINHIDIKDNIEVGTYKSVPYGTGITKGEEIIKALIAKGFTGYMVIEQAPPIENLDVVTEMKRIKNIFQPLELNSY